MMETWTHMDKEALYPFKMCQFSFKQPSICAHIAAHQVLKKTFKEVPAYAVSLVKHKLSD